MQKSAKHEKPSTEDGMELDTEPSTLQATMNTNENESDGLNNQERVFWHRYDGMMHCYRNDRETEAFHTAEELLLSQALDRNSAMATPIYANVFVFHMDDLPLLIRARCHMVLCTDNQHAFFVQHAEEAVRVLDVECRAKVVPEAFPEKQLAESRRLLVSARELAEEKATKAAKKARQAAGREASVGIESGDQTMTNEEEDTEVRDVVGDLPGDLPAHAAQQIRDALRSGFAGPSGRTRSKAGAPTPPASTGVSRTSSREMQQALSVPARSNPAPTPPASKGPSRNPSRRMEGGSSSVQPSDRVKPSLAPLSIPRLGGSTTEPTPRTQIATELGSLSFGSMPSAQTQAQAQEDKDEDGAMKDVDEAGSDGGEK